MNKSRLKSDSTEPTTFQRGGSSAGVAVSASVDNVNEPREKVEGKTVQIDYSHWHRR